MATKKEDAPAQPRVLSDEERKAIQQRIQSKIQKMENLDEYDRVKILLTGPSGSRKSSFAAAFPRPLIALTEMQAVRAIKKWGNKDLSVFLIKTYQDILDFQAIASAPNIGQKFDTIVCDSLTDMQRIVREHFTSQQTKRNDVTDMETWGVVGNKMEKFIRTVRDCRCHVVLLTLDDEKHVKDQGVLHRPALDGRLKNELKQFVQAVGYTWRKEMPSGEYRYQISFELDESYTTKRDHALDAVEPMEPEYLLAKMLGQEVPADVQARVDAWREFGQEDKEKKENQVSF